VTLKINNHSSCVLFKIILKLQNFTIIFKPELDVTLFVKDEKDTIQIFINHILKNIDTNEIKKICAIYIITTLTFCYFVIFFLIRLMYALV